MSWLRALTVDSPAWGEAMRPVRKVIKPQSVKGGAGTSIVVGVIIGCFVLVGATYHEILWPLGLMYGVVVIGLLVSAVAAHNTISGEREKRSLDLLLAAPVSTTQLVAAKFLAGLWGMLLAWGSGVVVACASLILRTIRAAHLNIEPDLASEYLSVGLGGLFILTPMLATLALSLYISARSRNGLGSLLAVIAAMVVVFVVLPAVIAPLAGTNPLPLVWHPFGALWSIGAPEAWTGPDRGSRAAASWIVLSSAVGYLLAAGALLWQTRNVLEAERRHGRKL